MEDQFPPLPGYPQSAAEWEEQMRGQRIETDAVSDPAPPADIPPPPAVPPQPAYQVPLSDEAWYLQTYGVPPSSPLEATARRLEEDAIGHLLYAWSIHPTEWERWSYDPSQPVRRQHSFWEDLARFAANATMDWHRANNDPELAGQLFAVAAQAATADTADELAWFALAAANQVAPLDLIWGWADPNTARDAVNAAQAAGYQNMPELAGAVDLAGAFFSPIKVPDRYFPNTRWGNAAHGMANAYAYGAVEALGNGGNILDALVAGEQATPLGAGIGFFTPRTQWTVPIRRLVPDLVTGWPQASDDSRG